MAGVQDREDSTGVVSVSEPESASASDSARVAPLTAAVFGCLLRAVVLTCAAGYTLGQVVHRHSGPPLIDFLSVRTGFAVLTIVGALTWLELAFLQTWPRVGLAITAFWNVAILVVGCNAAVTDGAAWLLPMAVFVVPALLSLVRARAWRAPSRHWRWPPPRRVAATGLVHGVGAVALVAAWTAAAGSAPWVGAVALGVVLLTWLLAAADGLPGWRHRAVVQTSGLLVAPQVSVFVALTLFVTAAVG